ncbi:HD-GYP domain-containing protein [Clostridium beijerinckii]|uniref:HD-GYP domain-containing protein n=1 Tax=Clostridium beijerinckii TaxID=1520 RepID=UPI00156F1F7A|nr:HD-GYP domain-containing protein [Clostridium beijerinckii]
MRVVKLLKKKMSLFKCGEGMHLAEDITQGGTKIVSRNTILNSYIIEKLINMGQYSVYVYISEHEKCSCVIKEFNEDYNLNLNIIREVISELISTSKVNLNNVRQVCKSIIRYLNEPNIVIECLNSIQRTDEYTYIHCMNVGIYSMLIAKWINLPLDSINDIIQSGILHDIGKIKITNEILNKPNKLTNEEFDQMKKHPVLGYELIDQYNMVNQNIKNAILMHHERLDGSGYPLGRREKDITLYAKIIAVADTFDAMTSNRVYKKGTIPFEAFKMFMTDGLKQYDIPIVFALLENLTPYYIGMRAILEDGREGRIIYIPPNDILSPIIEIDDMFLDISREKNIKIANILSNIE